MGIRPFKQNKPTGQGKADNRVVYICSSNQGKTLESAHFRPSKAKKHFNNSLSFMCADEQY
ncbi:hypothetical protein ACFQZE_11505 [Paenibacillus sp. GCM10027627]|uniref:hypothetical protein n=1 Tax=unclassified Paenibacillus TaxID=185978 RepID=UPI00362DABA6